MRDLTPFCKRSQPFGRFQNLVKATQTWLHALRGSREKGANILLSGKISREAMRFLPACSRCQEHAPGDVSPRPDPADDRLDSSRAPSDLLRAHQVGAQRRRTTRLTARGWKRGKAQGAWRSCGSPQSLVAVRLGNPRCQGRQTCREADAYVPEE